MNGKWFVFLTFALFLIGARSAQAQLLFNLNPAGQSGLQGATLTFNATLTNTGMDPLFLNGVGASGLPSALVLDNTPFFLNAPLSLASGDVWTGDILTVSIAANATPGNYVGLFYIVGGTDEMAQDTLASQFFLVTVQSPSSDVPEPGALALLMGTAMFGSGLLLRRRRKRG